MGPQGQQTNAYQQQPYGKNNNYVPKNPTHSTNNLDRNLDNKSNSNDKSVNNFNYDNPQPNFPTNSGNFMQNFYNNNGGNFMTNTGNDNSSGHNNFGGENDVGFRGDDSNNEIDYSKQFYEIGNRFGHIGTGTKGYHQNSSSSSKNDFNYADGDLGGFKPHEKRGPKMVKREQDKNYNNGGGESKSDRGHGDLADENPTRYFNNPSYGNDNPNSNFKIKTIPKDSENQFKSPKDKRKPGEPKEKRSKNSNSTASSPRNKDELDEMKPESKKHAFLYYHFKKLLNEEILALHKSLVHYSKKWEPMRSVVFRRLQYLVSKTFTGGAQEITLKKYGSWVTNLLIPESDIDLLICGADVINHDDAVQILNTFTQNLELFKWVKKAKCLDKAQIPILMIETDPFVHFGAGVNNYNKVIGSTDQQIIENLNLKINLTKNPGVYQHDFGINNSLGKSIPMDSPDFEDNFIKVDISVETNQATAQRTTEFVRMAVNHYQPLSTLVVLVKYFLQQKGLNKPYQGIFQFY
jgi:DNA polymerase sigma